jgi:hypothetical protein
MNRPDTLRFHAAETPANVAPACRVCGSANVTALPIGVYAPFFQLRVDVRRDRFALWTRAGSIEAPPDFRKAGGIVRRIARGVKRRLSLRTASDESSPRMLRTMCLWCTNCHGLTPAHEFSFNDLMPLYADYRSASYNSDRISVEPGYAALAPRVGADAREVESRNAGVVRFVLPHLPSTPQSGARALDLGGSDGRFIPPELIARHSPTHVVDTSDAAIEPSLAARGVQKVRAPDVGGYDLVMCMHVLEHVGYPRNFVIDAMQSLLVGGLLYLEIPLELDPQTSAQFAARTVDRTITFHEHINQFDTRSLAQLVASIEGLELVANEAADLDCGWTKVRVGRALARRVG